MAGVHYKDWPNTQGFDVDYQELSPKELSIQGTIPAYCAGVLFRNGLGPRAVKGDDGRTIYKTSHWFDSFSQVHRFQIHAPTPESPHVRVTHNSRLTSDRVIERIKRTGCLYDFSFGAKRDPCMSLFQKAQAVFEPADGEKEHPADVNVSVSLSANFPGLSEICKRAEGGGGGGGLTLVNKTDTSLMQALDPETLEPIGVARQSVLHPKLAGPLSAAHASTCPKTGDVFNYNLEVGTSSTYRVFTVSASTGETSILATIDHRPTYIHSLFMSENYVVLCAWNCHFMMGGTSMMWKRNMLECFAPYDKTKPATWFVVDRKPGGRGLVATFESDAFFAFHTVNAFEVGGANEGEIDIVADICTYENTDCMTRFYVENLLSDSPSAKKINEKERFSAPRYSRFRLPGVPTTTTPTDTSRKGKAVWEYCGPAEIGGPELPSINEGYRLREHRYVYGVTGSGKSTFLDGIVKLDVKTGEATHWSHIGQTASEPIFVPDPDPRVFGIQEDAGVLLTVVLDGIEGESYLLVLDAKNMEEIGRAPVGSVVGFGFHGIHVPSTS